jgi:methylthioribose-1-phosphate isomerase
MDPSDHNLLVAAQTLMETRPTAVNLQWAIREVVTGLSDVPVNSRLHIAYELASDLAEHDVEVNESIGVFGLELIQKIAHQKPGMVINILTHCNAGWLGTVDWGTALAPIYKAHDLGIPVHVWVDETRPRNQGASLTVWELKSHGVPHTLIVDNAGGHLMQHGMVDMCIVGTDRTTSNGDVCNKIGTYLKALAAHDNNIPFYVALPSSTIDWELTDGVKEIPIELRSEQEVTEMTGLTSTNQSETIQITPLNTKALNPAFDVTPARLVTALITEYGVCDASKEGLLELFPEKNNR